MGKSLEGRDMYSESYAFNIGDGYEVLSVQREDVDQVWQQVEPLLSRAAEERVYGNVDMKAIREDVRRGAINLAVVIQGDQIHGVCGVELWENPRGKWLDISLLGGHRLENWFKGFADVLMVGARNLECNRIRVAGRPGWRKLLDANFDCRTAAVVFDVKVEK